MFLFPKGNLCTKTQKYFPLLFVGQFCWLQSAWKPSRFPATYLFIYIYIFFFNLFIYIVIDTKIVTKTAKHFGQSQIVFPDSLTSLEIQMRTNSPQAKQQKIRQLITDQSKRITAPWPISYGLDHKPLPPHPGALLSQVVSEIPTWNEWSELGSESL